MVLSVGAFAGSMPKNATLIPALREIRATGGEYLEKKPPKLERVAGLPPEGYELSITTNGITIRHSDDAGAFYAKITLFHSGRWDSKAKCKVYPCLEIRDWPQFRWRGVHLDDSRRFFGKEAVLQLLKQMSWFKFNVLHWHLTDDQLWSLEIPGFPELQKYGAEWYINGPAKWRGEKVGPLEWKMWPRGFALAEVLWTYPDPAKRDFKEFEERAANYRRRLIGAHVNCAPLK